MSGVVTHDDTGNDCRSVPVIVIDLSRGYVKFAVQADEQGLDASAFVFQGIASRQVEFNRQRDNMHNLSVSWKW